MNKLFEIRLRILAIAFFESSFIIIYMKKCKNCGTIVPDDSKYCYKCGASSFVEEDDVSLSDYGASDPYHSVSNENEDSSPKEEDANQVTTEENNQNCSSSVTSDNSSYHTFAILSVVFGALGGLLGLIFGIIVLSGTKDKADRKKAIIGIALFSMWMIVTLIITALNLSRLFF